MTGMLKLLTYGGEIGACRKVKAVHQHRSYALTNHFFSEILNDFVSGVKVQDDVHY